MDYKIMDSKQGCIVKVRYLLNENSIYNFSSENRENLLQALFQVAIKIAEQEVEHE